jgi:hypothetical protein
MMNQQIYLRLLDKVGETSARKFATTPPNADMKIWGVWYNNEWPDLSMFAGNEGMTWEQAYNRVLDLRDVMYVMAS